MNCQWRPVRRRWPFWSSEHLRSTHWNVYNGTLDVNDEQKGNRIAL